MLPPKSVGDFNHFTAADEQLIIFHTKHDQETIVWQILATTNSISHIGICVWTFWQEQHVPKNVSKSSWHSAAGTL